MRGLWHLTKESHYRPHLAFTQQGRWDRAINEYLAILKADPSDLSVYNLLGDSYARIGDRDEAISYYERLGDLYRTDGLSVKAIAVYKKIIKLDPAHVPSYLACGDLYAEQGPDRTKRGFNTSPQLITSWKRARPGRLSMCIRNWRISTPAI